MCKIKLFSSSWSVNFVLLLEHLQGADEVVELVCSTLGGVVDVEDLGYAEAVLEVEELVGFDQVAAVGFELLTALVEAGYLLVVVGGYEDLDGASWGCGCVGWLCGALVLLGGEGLPRWCR